MPNKKKIQIQQHKEIYSESESTSISEGSDDSELEELSDSIAASDSASDSASDPGMEDPGVEMSEVFGVRSGIISMGSSSKLYKCGYSNKGFTEIGNGRFFRFVG